MKNGTVKRNKGQHVTSWCDSTLVTIKPLCNLLNKQTGIQIAKSQIQPTESICITLLVNFVVSSNNQEPRKLIIKIDSRGKFISIKNLI